MSVCGTYAVTTADKKEKHPLKSPDCRSRSMFNKQVKSFWTHCMKNLIFKIMHVMASDAQGNQRSDFGGATEMYWLLNKASSVFSVASEAGGGGHWLLLKDLLSVLAVSLSSGAPAAAYQTLPKNKATLCLFFFCFFLRGRKDRLLMRPPVSKLRSSFETLVSGFSSHCKKK